MSAHLKVLGIYREEKFSNRAVDADKAIMDEVLKTLRSRLGKNVAAIAVHPEKMAFGALDFNFDLIFSMSQDEEVLKMLDQLQSRGAVVVNSAKSIRNCFRGKLSELLSSSGFLYPRYVPLDVKQDACNVFHSERGYWVKRGDFHALADEDVLHVQTVDKLPSVIDRFKNRGVEQVILQENCEGELFKFYGVRNAFFNLRYMGRTTTDRYGFTHGNPDIIFDRKYLEKLAHRAAGVLDLDYFGGDCIVSPIGEMHFIDFNDWPSFRTCAKEVAPAMVTYALNKINGEAVYDCCINQ